MSSLQFKDYFFQEISYKRNNSFDTEVEKINVVSKISARIIINEKTQSATINLITKHGDLSLKNSAFELNIDIVGHFEYRHDDSEYDIKFETFLKENGLAILWSFIRPTVSDMITRGNEFPNFILPVVNVRNMLEDNDLIEISYEN